MESESTKPFNEVPKRLLEQNRYVNYNMDQYNPNLAKQNNEFLNLGRDTSFARKEASLLETKTSREDKNESSDNDDRESSSPDQSFVAPRDQSLPANTKPFPRESFPKSTFGERPNFGDKPGFGERLGFGERANFGLPLHQQNSTFREAFVPPVPPVLSAREQSLPTNDFSNFQPYRPKRNQEFIKTERGKVMIFIDGSNLFYTAQMMGMEIDYLKLTEHLVGRDKLVRVNFYAGVDVENQSSSAWQYFMKRSGFKLYTKPLQYLPDGTRKANCDVEMAIDMLNMSNNFDTCVLVSGDGDLTYAVNNLVNKGKQVEVVGNKSNTNDNLIHAADRFIDLEQIRTQIQKCGKY